MLKKASALVLVAVWALSSAVQAGEISGHYLEARTCQVYTGPCFANAEIGLTGKDAVMAWSITDGQHDGVDLAGLKVVLAVRGSHTLGHGGLNDARELKSIIFVDHKASEQQRTALIDFARTHAGAAGKSVVRVSAAPIEMSLNELELKGNLQVAGAVKLVTRKAGRGDCICSNETAYYPPLAQVQHFAPGVSIENEVKGRGLGTQWSMPGARNAYMATFTY